MKPTQMTRYNPVAPPKLDLSALDGASRLRDAIHNVLREVSVRMSHIDDKTLSQDAVARKRADVAKAALVQLDIVARSRLREIEARLAGLQENIRSLRANGGEPHAAFTRQAHELENAFTLCRHAVQNAEQMIRGAIAAA
jgi:hypothetical protein